MGYLLLLLIPFSVFIWGFAIDLLSRTGKAGKVPADVCESVGFTILIPAHNEESCIFALLDCMEEQTYSNFETVVIADFCTDNTKRIASCYEKTEVLEKITPSTCKGDALNYAVSLLTDRLDDVVVVLDADSTVNPKFLEKLNECYRRGSMAVMADTDIFNPGDSIISGWYTLYWKMVSEMSRKAHAKLGLSCNLCGSGMSFRKELLRPTVTITEDVEYFMALGIQGVRIDYAEEAKVYQEQPTTVRCMLRQLYRWMNGVRSVNRHYLNSFLQSLRGSFSLQKFDALMTSQTCSAYGLFTAMTLVFLFVGALFSRRIFVALTFLTIPAYAIYTAISCSAARRCALGGKIRPLAVPTYCIFLAIMGFVYIYAAIFPGSGWMKVDRIKRNEQKN